MSTTQPDPHEEHADDAAAFAAASRRWRSLWRVHFYSGVFAMPFILLMAVTGLVILYTQPLQDTLQSGLRTVETRAERVSYDAQAAAAAAAVPDASIESFATPVDDGHSTVFVAAEEDGSATEVFVDPGSGEVLGTARLGGDLVGLSNRLHGYLDANESWTVPLPSVAAIWDDEPIMRDYVIGDLVLELLGVWTLVLVLSGLYLWWPRRSRSGGAERTGRRLLSVRWSKGGRARWRDLHGIAGVAGLVMMVITLVSGFAWSTYWGANFSSLANEISPDVWSDTPPSPLGERGDLDREGNQIPWNTGDRPIPASYATAADGTSPAPVSLDRVVAIGEEEGMRPGFSVAFPANADDEAGNPVYGSFTLSNFWPQTTGDARDLWVDQFSGETLGEQAAYGYGSVSYAMDTVVSTHMGTQLGLFSRLLMTALCVLSIWSVVSAAVMYLKRRRRGTLGLPRRPVDVRLSPRLGLMAVGLGVVFPQWAVTALVILGLDRFVVRRVPRLRRTFGQVA